MHWIPRILGGGFVTLLLVGFVAMAMNPPHEFKHGDEIRVVRGFYEGRQGIIIDQAGGVTNQRYTVAPVDGEGVFVAYDAEMVLVAERAK